MAAKRGERFPDLLFVCAFGKFELIKVFPTDIRLVCCFPQESKLVC